MSLNFEVDAISSGDITTVSAEIAVSTAQVDGTKTSYNFTTDAKWVVPGSVKVAAGTNAER